MSLTPINSSLEAEHKKRLEHFYKNDFIPAEKKPYITSHKDSRGPYLAIEGKDKNSPHHLQDAASQIATLGLGFNPKEFFGVGLHQESWTNNSQTKNVDDIRRSLLELIQRETGDHFSHIFLTNSGAESNEVALGNCWRKRPHNKRTKILAFEGSFHGRMLATLASTWNKTKREPFEWEGYQTEYCTFPASTDGKINYQLDQKWLKNWSEAPSQSFVTEKVNTDDPLLESENHSLMEVRNKLLKDEIFALIVEPMQCEGGDRYATNRFFSALLLMAQAFRVPVIFDEVQTGFHLGRKFFWHRDLELFDDKNNSLSPDYVTCAKKSQTGIVISKENIPFLENYSVASLLRGTIHAQALVQLSSQIKKLELDVSSRLDALVKEFSEFIESPRVRGLAFAFDLKENERLGEIIASRFKHGLLYYQAGSHTLRYRLNTAFKEEDLDYLFFHLKGILNTVYKNQEIEAPETIKTKHSLENNDYYKYHLELVQNFAKLKNDFKTENLDELFSPYDLEVKEITKENFKNFKQGIEKLQIEVYEPARQTSIKKFEALLDSSNSIALGLFQKSTDRFDLAGISFAGPLQLFQTEPGVRRDSDIDDEKSLYMLDTTISPQFQGKGLGEKLKTSVLFMAQHKGLHSLSGRNRDQFASQMLRINLSLGAKITEYGKEDYLDNEKHRDVLYYKIKTRWDDEKRFLSGGLSSPLSIGQLDSEHIEDYYPTLVNKVCLSNFVSLNYLKNLELIANKLPSGLKHLYTASGQSECVDKVIKSLWYEKNTSQKLLSVKGQFFGHGSFASRSLSGQDTPYFETTFLSSPFDLSSKEFLDELEQKLKKQAYLGLFLEPLEQLSMRRIPFETLKEIKRICETHKCPLVYNETASSLYRYRKEKFSASSFSELKPSATFFSQGGQSAIVAMDETFFIAKPLMMISTWDGDEASLGAYCKALNEIDKDFSDYQQTVQNFDKSLKVVLSDYNHSHIDIENGVGQFRGFLPPQMQKLFQYNNGAYLI
ncbi:MAG: aminotransferase class III-fold pyridoxal phosphate-dependent enzyme, partial [Bacteriovoracaceae bacterium]